MKKIKSIALIFAAAAFSFMLTGCSSLNVFKGGSEAEEVVKEFLSAVSKDDSDRAKACLVSPNEYESLTTVARQLGMDGEKTKKFSDQYTSIKFSIQKTEKEGDGNKASVMVFMTVPDYSNAFAQGLSQTNDSMNSGQAMRIVIEKMADTKPETVHKAVAVAVVKNGDKWLIDYSNNNIELLNAINGNVLNALHGSLSM